MTKVAVKTKLEILKAEVFENLLDDVGNLLVLENPAIGRARQEPQPRHHLRAVGREPPVLRALREPADETVPVTLGAVRIENAQRDVLSDHVLELDRIVLRQQIEIEMEELRNRFRAGEAAQQQDVLAERRRDRDAAICLCVWPFSSPMLKHRIARVCCELAGLEPAHPAETRRIDAFVIQTAVGNLARRAERPERRRPWPVRRGISSTPPTSPSRARPAETP